MDSKKQQWAEGIEAGHAEFAMACIRGQSELVMMLWLRLLVLLLLLLVPLPLLLMLPQLLLLLLPKILLDSLSFQRLTHAEQAAPTVGCMLLWLPLLPLTLLPLPLRLPLPMLLPLPFSTDQSSRVGSRPSDATAAIRGRTNMHRNPRGQLP